MRTKFRVLGVFGMVTILILALFEIHISQVSIKRSFRPFLSTDYTDDLSVGNSAILKEKNLQLVLIYSEFFYGGVPWKGLKDSNDFTQFNGEKCPVANCNLTYNKTADFLKSDVVIFHVYNMPKPDEMLTLQKRRPNGQIWVYFNLENPIVTSYIAPLKHRRDLDGVFNWTMTFARDSDIYFPYGFYLPLKRDERKEDFQIQNHAKGRDKLAVWTASGCGQQVAERGIRVKYVQQLGKHLRIDVYGECAKHFNQSKLTGVTSCSRNFNSDGLPNLKCKALLQSYKFFLAFENMNCVDYITEKYWCTPLELGLVPVVMGGADYKALAIPGSYIDVSDFASQKELANYLLYLDKNDTAYNQYFEWKKHYKVGGCFRRQNMVANYPWMCKVCEAANDESLKRKSYDRMQDLWNPEKRCAMRYSRVKEVFL